MVFSKYIIFIDSNQPFIFDKHRNLLVSSDTQGEIVFEKELDIEQLPLKIVDLILHLKDSIYY